MGLLGTQESGALTTELSLLPTSPKLTTHVDVGMVNEWGFWIRHFLPRSVSRRRQWLQVHLHDISVLKDAAHRVLKEQADASS